MALFTSPLDPRANCYVSLAEANRILASRPYVDAWNPLWQVPVAEGYSVDGAVAPAAVTVPVAGGTGGFGDASTVQFGNDPTYYILQAPSANPATSLSILPGLAAALAGGETVYRITPNEAESYLIWATQTLDAQVNWNGFPTNACGVQELRWPRSGVVDLDDCLYDDDVFPELLRCATAEMALEMAKRDLSTTPGVMGQGFKKAEIPGPLKIEVDPTQVLPMFSDYILAKLAPLGKLYPFVGNQGLTSVSLARS